MRDRKKLIKILIGQELNVGETIKELIENYEESRSGLSNLLDSYTHIQYNIGSNKTDFRSSLRDSLNFYNLENKIIYLEPKCFEPEDFVIESLGLVIHETLHSYFTIGKEGMNDFVFDKEGKPGFSEVVNLFEDFRINTMSGSFLFYGQEMIKSIHANYSKKIDFTSITDDEIKNNKLNSLRNFVLARSIKRIGGRFFDKELNNIYLVSDRTESIFPKECKIIEDFLIRMIPQYGTYFSIKGKIRTTFTEFVHDLYENIYKVIFEELYKNENNIDNNSSSSEGKQNKTSSKGGDFGDDEQGDVNESGDGGGQQSFDPFGEEFNESSKDGGGFEKNEEEDGEINEGNLEKVKEQNEKEGKDKNGSGEGNSYSKEQGEINSKEAGKRREVKEEGTNLNDGANTEYDKIAFNYSHTISDLYNKLLNILQKKRDTIVSGFDKGKTVDGNTLIKNKLKILGGSLRNDQLFKGSFKKQNKEGKKALNVIALGIDDSGSMSGNPIKLVRESGTVISEALRKLSVKYCISSFSKEIYNGDNSLNYKKMGEIEAFRFNDEVSMFDRLIKNVDELIKISIGYEVVNGLYIFITDGFCSRSEINSIKEILEKIRSKGHQVFVLGIFEDDYDKEQTISNFEELYGEGYFEYLDDIKKLPDSLIKIIKENFK